MKQKHIIVMESGMNVRFFDNNIKKTVGGHENIIFNGKIEDSYYGKDGKHFMIELSDKRCISIELNVIESTKKA